MSEEQRWHVCPVCGLAGPEREDGFGYCRGHGDQPIDEPPLYEHEGPTAPDGRPLTMIRSYSAA
jgi:hypothetical protein